MDRQIDQSSVDRFALAYSKLTGFSLDHRGVFDHRTRGWYEFIKAGFTIDDMELVILWIKRGIRDGKRNPGALRFSNLILRPEMFGEELELAKAEKRNVKPQQTPRERVMAQARPIAVENPTKEQHVTGRHVSELIAELRKAAGMDL